MIKAATTVENRRLIFLLVAALLVVGGIYAAGFAGSAVSLQQKDQANTSQNKLDAPAFRGESRPNVILIVMDSVRADHIGPCYGYNRTTASNICRLARDGVFFSNAYAGGVDTMSSLPQLLSSLPPNSVALANHTDKLSNAVPTIADVLKERYRTVLLPGIRKNHPQGWGQGVEEELSSIEALSSFKEPFFAWKKYVAAHQPWDPAHRFRKWENISLSSEELAEAQPYIYVRPAAIENTAVRENIIDLYDEEILETDYKVGGFMKKLKEQGLYEESIIIVTADHGELLGEHGKVGHSLIPFQEIIHVPLFIKFPYNRYAGTTVEQPVRHVDIAPTLYEYLRINDTPATFGKSLLGAVKGKKFGIEVVSAQTANRNWIIIEDGYKYYLHNLTRCITNSTVTGGNRLYNLKKDPEEMENLVDTKKEKVEELRQRLCEVYRWGSGRFSVDAVNTSDVATSR